MFSSLSRQDAAERVKLGERGGAADVPV